MSNISVCMATYNGEKYISVQLASILDQLGPNDEVIISDDSSSDQTTAIIKSFNDNRIKLFENQKFANHIKNFEFVLNKVTGQYVFMADQDDIWMPDKIKISLDHLKDHNLTLSDCILIDKHGNEFLPSYFAHAGSETGLIKNFYKNCYIGCCMAFNRDILEKSLPFPPNIVSHDNWIGMVAEMFGNPVLIHKPLIKLRRHGKNFSAQKGADTFITLKTPYSLTTILMRRAYVFAQLVKRLLQRKISS